MFSLFAVVLLALGATAQKSEYGYTSPSYGYGYQPARSSYGGYAPNSYGYGYQRAVRQRKHNPVNQASILQD